MSPSRYRRQRRSRHACAISPRCHVDETTSQEKEEVPAGRGLKEARQAVGRRLGRGGKSVEGEP